MSTDTDVGAIRFAFSDEGSSDLIPVMATVDRVLATADDRPSPSQDSLPLLVDPAADHQDEAIAGRRADVEEKHRRAIRFLAESRYDALLLTRPESLAWFSSGGELGREMTGEAGAVALLVTPRCRAVLCDNVQSARVFEEELAGLGFQLKERPWHADLRPFVADLARSRRIATDATLDGLNLPDETQRLRSLRYPLTNLERQRYRELGRTVALALEATCRNFQPGETEAHVAGHLAHRLLREGVVPIDLRVAGDDRLARFRQPTFKSAAIRRRAMVAAVGRRHGLCVAASRTVSFGPVDGQTLADHGLAAMVDATCIYFSRPGETAAGVARRARRIFEKFDRPDEWMLDYQGSVIGYAPREAMLRPDSTIVLANGMPVRWSPSVGSVRSEDTTVVDDRGFEVVTEAQRWPKVEVLVKGFTVQRPGILER